MQLHASRHLFVFLLAAVVCSQSTLLAQAAPESEPGFFKRLWVKIFPKKAEPVQFAANDDPLLSALTFKERTQAGLEAAQAGLLRPKPDDWDATLFLPNTALSEVLTKGLKTLTLELPELKAIRFTCRDVSVRSGYGAGEVALGFNAAVGGTGVSMDLVLTGAVVYLGYQQQVKEGKDLGMQPTFFIAVKDVRPRRGGDMSAVLGQGVGAALTVALRDHLRIPIPVPPVFKFDTVYEDKEEKDYQKVKTGDIGSLRVKLLHKSAYAGAEVEHASALFVPEGLWLGLSQKPLPAPPAVPVEAKLSDLLKGYSSAATKAPVLHLKGTAIEGALTTAFAMLKEDESRTLHAYVMKSEGAMFYKKWRDNVLGEGGTRVSLPEVCDADHPETSGDRGPNGSFKISLGSGTDAAPHWSEKGLRVGLHYDLHAAAPLHVHIDPMATGGIGSTVGCLGDGGGDISATVGFESVSGKGDARGLALRPMLTPVELKLELRTNGKFKVGSMQLDALGGWTDIPGFEISVPQFGGNVTVPLDADTLPRFTVVDNAPRRLTLFDPQPDGSAKSVRLRVPDLPLYLMLAPGKVTMDAEGIRAECTVEAAAMTDESASARTKAVKEALKSDEKIKLPKPALVSFNIGDLEVGENSVVWKSVREIINAGKNAVETGKKTVEEISSAAKKALEILTPSPIAGGGIPGVSGGGTPISVPPPPTSGGIEGAVRRLFGH